MSIDYEGMSDADLDAAIMGSEPTQEVGSDSGVDESHVSPIIEDSTEQPAEDEVDTDVDQSAELDEDSGDDSTDEDQTDDSDPETSDDADEADEEDTDDDEDKGSDSDDNNSKTATEFQPLKANGKEYPIDSIQELYKMASAGVGAQQKFQAIAGHKKTIMAAEKAEVNLMDAVNLAAEYKANPKAVIARLLKESKIDPLDIDTDAEIEAAKDHSVSDFEVKYDEVIGEIGDSPIFPQVQELLLNGWDETSRAKFLEDPSMIKSLHDEMTPMEKDGKSMFDLVSPMAEKMKLSGDTRADFDIYMEARGKKVEEFEKFNETKQTTSKPKPKVNNKAKKKAASPTGGNKAGVQPLDFAAMSDAELDAFLEKA
jgi:hypothetical protein